jgi:DegV family protein with EDD domain
MAKVKVVTDSTAYFEAGTAKAIGISVVPLRIHFGDEVYEDGVNLSTDEFFRRMERASSPPTTSPPSVKTFEELYARLHTTTDQILSIHVSSRLSQTCRNAAAGAGSLLGRCKIVVVDSLTTSLGLGMLATAAADLADMGANVDEIVRVIRGMIPHIYIVFFVETIDYLERGGRLGKAQAILGSMLNIKPLLFVEDGEIIPLEKVRTRAKAIDKLHEFAAEFAHIDKIAIIQRDTKLNEDANALIERLQLTFPGISVPIIQYNPLLACHVGPNAMGIIVYEGTG